MTKYYDWDEHRWITEEEATKFKSVHIISEYSDDWVEFEGMCAG